MARPLVICGPSGVGKGTLFKKLMEEFPAAFALSVSHTTRKPRPALNEKDGVEYHFVSRDEMKTAIAAGEFIENAEFSGNMYGTSKKAVRTVLEAGKICILDIEMEGVKQVKACPDLAHPMYAFIKPPSMEVLEKRLRDRKTETEESIKKRLNKAREELQFGEEKGNFDVVIVNDDLEDAYKMLREFVLPEVKRQQGGNGTATNGSKA